MNTIIKCTIAAVLVAGIAYAGSTDRIPIAERNQDQSGYGLDKFFYAMINRTYAGPTFTIADSAGIGADSTAAYRLRENTSILPHIISAVTDSTNVRIIVYGASWSDSTQQLVSVPIDTITVSSSDQDSVPATMLTPDGVYEYFWAAVDSSGYNAKSGTIVELLAGSNKD